jgi:hypothetical protein
MKKLQYKYMETYKYIIVHDVHVLSSTVHVHGNISTCTMYMETCSCSSNLSYHKVWGDFYTVDKKFKLPSC